MTVCDRCGERAEDRVVSVKAHTVVADYVLVGESADLCKKCIEVLRDVVGAFFHAKYFHPKGH